MQDWDSLNTGSEGTIENLHDVYNAILLYTILVSLLFYNNENMEQYSSPITHELLGLDTLIMTSTFFPDQTNF